jgi:hypothetical protein
MDPILSWVVCLLSAFLLATGGYLLARAATGRRLARRVADIVELKETLGKLLAERKVAMSRERTLMNQLDGAERALRASNERFAERDGFGGPTELPDPKSYFDRDSVPSLQRLSEDEFEIPDAAPRGPKEAATGTDPGDELGGHDETRQFNLHSPENVVQFMQRIDELSDENTELRSSVASLELTVKEKRAEGNEQIHRLAALDVTAEKLRAELKRRNERIRILEDQLKGLLANDDGPLMDPNASAPPESGEPAPMPPGGTPPPLPPAAFAVGRSALKIAGPHDGPTLPVNRLTPGELDGDEK